MAVATCRRMHRQADRHKSVNNNATTAEEASWDIYRSAFAIRRLRSPIAGCMVGRGRTYKTFW